MCLCMYCGNSFLPRPQVKKAIACTKRDCQKKRQRSNERTWHINNKSLYGKKYHAEKKRERDKKIEKIAEQIIETLKVGCRFLHRGMLFEIARDFILQFVKTLGLRQINKLWFEKLNYHNDNLLHFVRT